MVRILLKQKTRVGPKGQIVIPKSIRESEKLYPGTEVLVELTGEGIKIEPLIQEDPIAVFERIAKSVDKKRLKTLDILHGYEEELELRWQKARKST